MSAEALACALVSALCGPAGAADDAAAPLTAPAPFLTITTGLEELALGPLDIRAVEISESGGITDIFLRLEPGAAAMLDRLTVGLVGRSAVIELCGDRLIEPLIRDRIASGTIYIDGVTAQEAETLRALWHGRRTCAHPSHGETDAK